MHTVCETKPFQRSASDAGMSSEEIASFVSFIAENPVAGDVIEGTGGCRKVRVAGKGKGKSGGFRVITFYSGEMLPIFLLTVFAKGERSNLSKSERNQLANMTTILVETYKQRIVPVQGFRA